MKTDKHITLSNTDETSVVSECDYDKIKVRRWHKDSNGYAVCYYRDEFGKEGRLFLHREVMCSKEGDVTDHINRDKLDNRRGNLRIVTTSQNGMNRGPNKGRPGGFKGAVGEDGKFVTKVMVEGVSIYVGTFATKEDAAKAYNIVAQEYFGEYACLNEIDHVGFSIREKRLNNRGVYRGVTYHKRDKRWQASRGVNGKKVFLGYHKTDIEAAKAYDDYLRDVLMIHQDLNFKTERELALCQNLT